MNNLVFNCPSLELNLNSLKPENSKILITLNFKYVSAKKNSQKIAFILPSKKYLENAM